MLCLGTIVCIWWGQMTFRDNFAVYHFPSFRSILTSSLLPHSADKVFRTQQISKWRGAMPDPKQRPKTAGEAARKGMSYYQMLQCEDG